LLPGTAAATYDPTQPTEVDIAAQA